MTYQPDRADLAVGAHKLVIRASADSNGIEVDPTSSSRANTDLRKI